MPSTRRGTPSSGRDADLNSPRSLLGLGEALVRELDLEQSNDILGRWMAHHLAGLIMAAREATPERRIECEARCSAVILEVWRHRNCLPEGRRPFEPLERAVDTLAALDPEARRPFYHRTVLQFEDFDDFDPPVDRAPRRPDHLEKARRFDETARAVIRHLIALAVQEAPDKTLEWVRLATEAELHSPDVALIIRLVRAGEEVDPARRGGADIVVRTLRSRLSEIDEFLDQAREVRNDIAERLAVAEDEFGSTGAEE